MYESIFILNYTEYVYTYILCIALCIQNMNSTTAYIVNKTLWANKLHFPYNKHLRNC